MSIEVTRKGAPTMTTNPKSLLVLAPLLLLASCGDAGQDGAPGTRGTLDGPDVMLNAVTDEVFTVGSVAGDNWDTFGNVRSVAFDNGGNLHIFDSQSEHILVVGPDGSLVRTVGGRGEGPGEFGNVSSAIVARDGSYTVLSSSRVDLLAPDGNFVRSVTLEQGLILASVALPDGRLVASQFVRIADFMASGEFPDPEGRPIHVIPLDGSEPTVHYTAWDLPEDPAAEDAGDDSEPGTIRLSAGRAFEPGLHFDMLTDGRLALADSIGYRVKLIGLDGGVAGVIERPIAPLAVSETIMEAERERYREETRQTRKRQKPDISDRTRGRGGTCLRRRGAGHRGSEGGLGGPDLGNPKRPGRRRRRADRYRDPGRPLHRDAGRRRPADPGCLRPRWPCGLHRTG